MPDRRMLYLISYDISSEKKRNRTASLLEDVGIRVQYSLFECFLSADQKTILESKLKRCINPDTDSIRLYPICSSCSSRALILGKKVLFDDPLPVLFV